MKKNNRGFTLIELIVVIAVIAVLSAIIMFSVSQYINTGKDSNVSGNLAVLIPAGEAWYNANQNSYVGFCGSANPDDDSAVVKNSFAQMPSLTNSNCTENNYGVNKGIPCCTIFSIASPGDAWLICAAEFADSTKAYCVDSRGVKNEICNSLCVIPMAYKNCTEALAACP